MQNPTCPNCKHNQTQRRGLRRGKIKYFCPECRGWFHLNRMRKKPYTKLLFAHLEGRSFRSLAAENNVSAPTIYRYCRQGLKELPPCIDVTRKYCNRFCGQLLVDGKFVGVRGYQKKIPVIYGIDYLSHDIPHYLLTRAENYQSCLTFFQSLRLANYPLQAVICDENTNIYEACRYIYPDVVVQLCQNHYKENVRSLLEVRKEGTNPRHILFMQILEKLFAKKRSKEELTIIAGRMVKEFSDEPLLLRILAELERKELLLFGYQYLKGIPTTTNLIECYNSHLQGRLETIKGFESFQHADLWLNGYFLKRRTKKFTDCEGKFRHLNGKTSLSKTLMAGIDTPIFF